MTDVQSRLMTLMEREQYGMPPIAWLPAPAAQRLATVPRMGIRVSPTSAREVHWFLTPYMAALLRERDLPYVQVGWDAKTRSVIVAPSAHSGWRVTRDGRMRDGGLVAWWDTQGFPRGVWLPGQEAPDGVWWIRIPDLPLETAPYPA